MQMTREHAAVVQGLEAQIQGLQEQISELHDEAFVRAAQHQGQVEGLNRDLDLVDMHRLRGL
jgi:TolA-binding protein